MEATAVAVAFPVHRGPARRAMEATAVAVAFPRSPGPDPGRHRPAARHLHHPESRRAGQPVYEEFLALSMTSSTVSGSLGWWLRHMGIRTFTNGLPSTAV